MNTNIALNARGIRLPQQNALAPYQQANAMLQLKANKQQMAQAEQAAQVRNAMLGELQGAADNTQRANVLHKYGQIDDALKLEEHDLKMAKSKREAEKSNFDLAAERGQMVGRIWQDIESQDDLNRAIQTFDELGIPLDGDDLIYTPEKKAQMMQIYKTSSDYLAQFNKDRDFNQAKEKFNYEKTRDKRADFESDRDHALATRGMNLKEQKANEEKEAETSSEQANIQQRGLAIDAIDKAVTRLDEDGMAAGTIRWPNFIPGTSRKGLQGDLTTIQSTVGLNRLIEAKRNGATFGSLTKNEMDLLISSLTAIDEDLPVKDLKQNLLTIRRLYNKANVDAGGAYKPRQGDTGYESKKQATLEKYGLK